MAVPNHQQGRVVVARAGPTWEDAVDDASDSADRPWSASKSAQELRSLGARAVTLAAAPSDGQFLVYRNGAFRTAAAAELALPARGATGAQGPTGASVRGAAGEQGPAVLVGDRGATGAQGDRGVQGDKGGAGSAGQSGATGSTGSGAGGVGATGAVGLARPALAPARAASVLVVPCVPADAATSPFSLPSGYTVSVAAPFAGVYDAGVLSPNHALGWSPASGASFVLELGAPCLLLGYGLAAQSGPGSWSVTGVASDASVGALALDARTAALPSGSFREFVLDATAWPVGRITLTVGAAATGLVAYFRLRPVPVVQALPAMLSGHMFRTQINFVAGTGDGSVLGLMQYTVMGRRLARISTTDHYGTSGQWIVAADKIYTPSGSWPWASIEGGFFVSEKLGGVRYHVAASSHRYNDHSDTLGGFGFFERGLPFKYLARVVLSQRLLLPPYGVCFPEADEGGLFGAGWIALPLFDFASAGVAKDPLTWTFFADASNFSGPVCCYPPQFFARRLAAWSAVRLAEDNKLPAAYGVTDVGAGLGFNGPRPGNVSMSVNGEVPNITCVFATSDPDGSMSWKVPEIIVPAAGSAWLADAAFFTERNYAQVKAQLETRGAVRLVAKAASLPTSAEFELGVKRVVEVGVTEIDSVLRIDARVARDAAGDAYVVAGTDAGKTLGRYYAQTDEIKDQIANGTGKIVNRRVCVPTTAPAALVASEYASGSKPAAFSNPALEEYVRARSYDGIRTATLEDGTTVRYGLVKFVEQPAIASLAVDFPTDFTKAKLDEVQARFELLAATDFAGQTRRSVWTQALVRVDPAMLVTPVAGYVPVAVGSAPAGGGVAQDMYTETW
jgi:hypothetical protein